MLTKDRPIAVSSLPGQALIFFCLLVALLAACAPGSGLLGGGGDWQSGGLQHQRIRVLAVDPTNAQNIYAGDAQGAIFASTDAGQRWTQRSTGLPLPNPLHSLSLDIPGKKIYAATDKGLFVSTDAARHWNALATQATGLPVDSFTSLLFDPAATSVVYAGTSHQGVFLSRNNGNSWQSVSTGLPTGAAVNDLALDPSLRQLWVATSSPTGLYASPAKDISWRSLANGLPSDGIINKVQPASVSGGAQGLVYVGTNKGFFRSQDAGVHWGRGQVSLSSTTVYSILLDFRSTNSTTLYIGTDLGALRSDDSGQNWRAVAAGLPKGQPVYDLTVGATGNTQLYAAANDVYLFPGTSSATDSKRIVPVILIIFFFYLLLRFSSRTHRNRRNFATPGARTHPPTSPTPTMTEGPPDA